MMDSWQLAFIYEISIIISLMLVFICSSTVEAHTSIAEFF